MEQPRITECCFLSLPKKGYRIIWEVTQQCPYSCGYCFTWSSPKREKLECDISRLISKMQTLADVIPIDDVLVTGGEPLMVANEIVPMLEFLTNRGISFSISTNLHNEHLYSVISRYKPRAVNLSIDPPSDRSASSAFKADFGRIREKLKVIEDSGSNAKLTAVISRETYRNVPALLEFLTELIDQNSMINKIAFNREYPVGFAAESQPQTKAELAKPFSLISEWSQEIPIQVSLVNWSEFHAPVQACPAGKHIVSVQQNGDVTPCSLLYNLSRSFRCGNLIEDRVDMIVGQLTSFATDLETYYRQTEEKTRPCGTCEHKSKCGGGCLAMLPIAWNHIPRRTCQINPERVKDHERLLISQFHTNYHEIYSPQPQKFAAPDEQIAKAVEDRMRDYVRRKLVPSDLAHTMEHIDSVVRLAKLITKEENASEKITIPAAYFHDIAPREPAMHHMHTHKSAILAEQYLKRTGLFTSEEIVHIQYCIMTSSYGSYLLGYRPLSLEAKVVRDADWLDAIGARGVARVFAFGQAHGAREMGKIIHDPEGLPITIDMNITGPDKNPIYHFFTKLLKIYHLLETPTAKRLGKERHNYMVQFLKQYQTESELVLPAHKQLPLRFV